MEFLDAKARLAQHYGTHPAVRGIGVLGRDRFGIYLWEGVEVELIELEGMSVELVRPGDEPAVDRQCRNGRRRQPTRVAPETDEDIPF